MRAFLIGLSALILILAGIFSYLIFYKQATISLAFNVPPTLSTSPVAPQENFADWHTYNSHGGHFTVLFPVLPQHVTHTVEDPKTKETRVYEMDVATQSDGTIFTIIQAIYQNPKWGDKKADLNRVVDELFKDTLYEYVTNMEMSPYKGFDALNFNISNDQVKIEGKAFIHQDSIYILSAIANPQSYSSKAFEFFFNSFDLTPLKEPSKTENNP